MISRQNALFQPFWILETSRSLSTWIPLVFLVSIESPASSDQEAYKLQKLAQCRQTTSVLSNKPTSSFFYSPDLHREHPLSVQPRTTYLLKGEQVNLYSLGPMTLDFEILHQSSKDARSEVWSFQLHLEGTGSDQGSGTRSRSKGPVSQAEQKQSSSPGVNPSPATTASPSVIDTKNVDFSIIEIRFDADSKTLLMSFRITTSPENSSPGQADDRSRQANASYYVLRFTGQGGQNSSFTEVVEVQPPTPLFTNDPSHESTIEPSAWLYSFKTRPRGTFLGQQAASTSNAAIDTLSSDPDINLSLSAEIKFR